MKKAMHLITVLGLVIGVTGAAHAQLVTNGSFESTTNGNGQLGVNTDVTGWSVPNSSYTFVYAPGTADTTGAPGQDGNVQLWGLNNGGLSALSASPDGGNFIAQDGGFQVGAISQTITGLTIGQTYTVSFDWAAAQQSGFTGDTTDFWTVGFGNQSFSTSTIDLPSHSFSGWTAQSFNYVATSTSQTLSFLATGTPSGEPPFALLDGVSVTPTTPEGSSLGLLGMGLLSLGGISAFARRARAAKSAKSVS